LLALANATLLALCLAVRSGFTSTVLSLGRFWQFIAALQTIVVLTFFFLLVNLLAVAWKVAYSLGSCILQLFLTSSPKFGGRHNCRFVASLPVSASLATHFLTELIDTLYPFATTRIWSKERSSVAIRCRNTSQLSSMLALPEMGVHNKNLERIPSQQAGSVCATKSHKGATYSVLQTLISLDGGMMQPTDCGGRQPI